MATRTGVSVFTWGSEAYSSDPVEYNTGMSQFASTSILGGNVGHASILLSLPDTEENRQLVATYLRGTHIPVETKKYETKEALVVDGKAVKTDRTVYEESVIEVYFSWWPNSETKGFAFNTFSEDCIAERKGVDAKYDKHWAKYLDPEVRRASSGIKSLLPSSTITLRAAHVVHDRGQSPEELKLLQFAHDVDFYDNQYQSAYRLWKKLDEQVRAGNTRPRLALTDEIIIRKIFPGQTVDLTNSSILRSQVLDRLNDISNQASISKFEYIRALADFNPHAAALNEAESVIYNQIQNIRSLSRIIGDKTFENLSTYDKNQIRNFMAGAYPERFPEGMTSDNFVEISALVSQDCDRKNVNGLAYSHNDILDRGDVHQLYECIHGIDSARELYANIEAFEKADDAGKVAAKNAILESLEKLPSLNLLFNSADSPLRDDFIPVLKSNVGNLVLPSKNGRYFKKFTEIMQYPGNDLNASLLNDRTRVVLQEGMSEGHRPSHKVDIPFRSEIANGLDPEAMLQQMALFANQGSAFNLVNNNCSVTSSAVLARGAMEHSWVFEQGAFGNSIANPQMVYNNAMQFASTKRDELIPPATSWYTSAQNYLAGVSIYHAAEATKPESSRLARLGNALGALSSGVFASAMMFVNALGESSEAHFEDLAPMPRKTQSSVNPLEIAPVAATTRLDSHSDTLKEEPLPHAQKDQKQDRRKFLTWGYEAKEDLPPLSPEEPKKPVEKIDIDPAETNTTFKPD